MELGNQHTLIVTVSNSDTRQSSRLEAFAWSSPQLIDRLQESGPHLNPQGCSSSRWTALLQRIIYTHPDRGEWGVLGRTDSQ
jgi:hypothetical protein